MILVYIIAKNNEEAKDLARDLFDKKLIYSANIISDISSMRLEGENIIEYNETLLFAKTKALLYKEIEQELKSYQKSDDQLIFSVPITQISHNLFDKIQKNTIKV
jgi:uncharacterized protein involved in tolerance to divalent cations